MIEQYLFRIASILVGYIAIRFIFDFFRKDKIDIKINTENIEKIERKKEQEISELREKNGLSERMTRQEILEELNRFRKE
jgi:predicted PilT family ATPase